MQGKKKALQSQNKTRQSNRQDKNNEIKTQKKTIFAYLQEYTVTASMVSSATGIPQKNICRYKRDLEKEGQLWETEKKSCKHTGFKAWYLTTNSENIPFDNQLKLF